MSCKVGFSILLAIVFSVAFVYNDSTWSDGQNVPPPQREVSRYIPEDGNDQILTFP